jgi:hypothetical protein
VATGSVVDDVTTVVAEVFDEGERRDPDHRRPWTALVDGNNVQIEAFRAEAERRGVDLPILVDFVHVLEYIWKAAWSFFDKGDPAAEKWVADKATKVLEGKAADVAAGIRRRATREGCSDAERGGADRAADYLTDKRPCLDYPAALAAGRPIATGVIEGACRHVPIEGPDGRHRRPLGPGRRRGRAHAARRGRQRRLRRLLFSTRSGRVADHGCFELSKRYMSVASIGLDARTRPTRRSSDRPPVLTL